MSSIVLSVDVGSTSARAGLFDRAGNLLARAEAPFATTHPLPGHAEHSSDEIWKACCRASQEARRNAGIDAAAIAGLAFDATCSLVLLNAGGAPVTVSTTGEARWNVVMWADHRAKNEAEEITAGAHEVLAYLGGVMSPEMQIPKLLWLERNLPQAWREYGMAFDLVDFLTWRATGNATASACSVTCKWTYLNHRQPGWQDGFFDAIGLSGLPRKLGLPARASEVGTACGSVLPQIAAELGVSRACRVGVGLIDAHAGGVGVLGGYGAEELNSRMAMIAGTSTCLMVASQEPRQIPGVWGPYLGAMLPGLWLNEAGQSASGALLDHLLDWHARSGSLGPEKHAEISRMASTGLDESGGAFLGELQVIPDFHGNRSPLAESDSVGIIHGLDLDSSDRSLVKLYCAAAIGMGLGVRHIVDAVNASGYEISRLHLTGGHAASPFLIQLYADTTNASVTLPEQPDAVLLGTACVAATAAGLHGSLDEAARAMVRHGQTVLPRPEMRDFFDRRYRTFLMMHEHRRAVSALS